MKNLGVAMYTCARDGILMCEYRRKPPAPRQRRCRRRSRLQQPTKKTTTRFVYSVCGESVRVFEDYTVIFFFRESSECVVCKRASRLNPKP